MAIYQPVKRNIIKQPLTKDEIIEALKTFYGKEKQREEKELSRIGVTSPQINKGVPLRIGRHSGAECVTVEGYRHIKIMQGKGKSPKFKDHATTIWLSSDSRKPQNNANLKPFGWATLYDIEQDAWEKLTSEMDVLRQCIYKEAKELSMQKIIQSQKEAEQKAKEEKRLQEKKKQEADPAYQRKIQLEAFERSLPKPADLPGYAAAILEKMEKMEDKELLKEAAVLFRERYQKQIKRAKKNKKAWAKRFSDLIVNLGI